MRKIIALPARHCVYNILSYTRGPWYNSSSERSCFCFASCIFKPGPCTNHVCLAKKQ